MKSIGVSAVALLGAFAVLSLSGCVASSTPASSPVSTTSTDYKLSHFAVDPPAATDTVLRVSGDSVCLYKMGELDAMAVTSISLFERFYKKTETFRGVWLAKLFAKSGLKSSDTVALIALDGYRYKDTVAHLLTSKAFLAVSEDGKAISADTGGPIRVVFPDNTKFSDVSDPWVWSLLTIARSERGQ